MTGSRQSEDAARAADPFAVWRQVYEANEQAWSKAMKDTMGTQTFAEASGKMLETFLSFQKALRDQMTAQLGSLNLPTREDVVRLGELIVGLEEKIDNLDDRLAAVEERLADDADGPEPLSAQLSSLAERLPTRAQLDQLVARLAALEERLAGQAPGGRAKAKQG